MYQQIPTFLKENPVVKILIIIILTTTAIIRTHSNNKPPTFTECLASLLTSFNSHNILLKPDIFIPNIKQRTLRL